MYSGAFPVVLCSLEVGYGIKILRKANDAFAHGKETQRSMNRLIMDSIFDGRVLMGAPNEWRPFKGIN